MDVLDAAIGVTAGAAAIKGVRSACAEERSPLKPMKQAELSEETKEAIRRAHEWTSCQPPQPTPF